MAEEDTAIFYILLFILAISLFFNFTTLAQLKKRQTSAERIYPHRGASGEEVEHTFAAYDLAIRYKCRYIEQDVVTSKDGTLIVSHDLSAKRITGVNRLYADMTDKEIRQLRTLDNQKILRLQDVFDAYGKSINYVIELKQNAEQTYEFLEIMRRNKLTKHVIVQTFEIEPLDDIAAVYPRIRRLLLVETQADFDRALIYPNVDIVAATKSLMNAENVQLVHDFEKQINIWTLNSDEEIQTAIRLGVDSYFTDYPGKAFLFEKAYR